MKQLPYQEKYVGQLVSASKEYLEDPYAESKVIIFQAPTGSGKTIMVSKAMVNIVKQFKDKSDIAFIWISVNDLHEQSRNSLERYPSEERLLESLSIDEIDDSRISENQILFANWESLNKKDNLFMQDNERNLETGHELDINRIRGHRRQVLNDSEMAQIKLGDTYGKETCEKLTDS